MTMPKVGTPTRRVVGSRLRSRCRTRLRFRRLPSSCGVTSGGREGDETRAHGHLAAVRGASARGDDLAMNPVDQAETRTAVLAAIERLGSRQASAILLKAVEDESYANVAQALGCSEATARVHVQRAGATAALWSGGRCLAVTPETAADHVFRGLVPVRVWRRPDGRTVHEFRGVGDRGATNWCGTKSR